MEPLPQVPPPIRPVVKPPDVPRPVSGRDVALADERALVEMARTAFARGDKPAALAALEQHSRRFPRGQLSEERESLRIQAWVQSGRFKEARAAAEAFRRSFPESMLLPLVEETLQAIGDAGR